MSLAVFKQTAPGRLSSLIKREFDPEYCREGYTLLAGDGSARAIKIGMPLALVVADGSIEVISSTNSDNTGDGTLALGDPSHTKNVQDGDYTITCTTGGTDGAANFRVEKPDGNSVGTATAGEAFSGHIKFTITAGATDFVEGDEFKVNVAVDGDNSSNKVVAWSPNANDGTQRLWGLAANNLTALDGVDAMSGLALKNGPAIISKSGIVWPANTTDAQKEDAYQALEVIGIKAR